MAEQTAGTDLHTRIREALEERIRLAKTATPGPWVVGRTTEADWGPHPPGPPGTMYSDSGGSWPRARTVEGTHVAAKGEMVRPVADMTSRGYMGSRFAQDATHIAANDPASTIRRAEAGLRVLARHKPINTPAGWTCDADFDAGQMGYPCVEVRELAAGEGLEP